MKIAVTICRILLGLLFTVIGVNGFLLFLPPPPPNMFPHYALLFNTAMFATHYMWFTSGVQVVCGLLVLANRFTGLALIVLGAVLANIFTFHITMWPQGLFPMPFVALALWIVTCWPLRHRFAPVFAARV